MKQHHDETDPPPQSPSSYDAAVEVARDIQPALNKLILIFQRTAEGSSLTTSQVSIMNQLRLRGPSRVSTIAQAELIRMPTASRRVGRAHPVGRIRIVRRFRATRLSTCGNYAVAGAERFGHRARDELGHFQAGGCLPPHNG